MINARIDHVRVNARIAGDNAQRNRLETRLKRIVHDDLLTAWQQNLARAFQADPDAVYILRTFTMVQTLRLGSDRLDIQIADEWSAGLTRAILQRIARGEDDALKIFPDMGAYIAHFIDVLLLGRAWYVWYFYPFAHLRSLDAPTAACDLLLEQRDVLPQILTALAELGTLDVLLRRLSPAQTRELWLRGLAAAQLGATDAARVLFVQLAALLDALDLWAASKPDMESRYDTFLAQSESLMLDWRDRRSLSIMVQAMFLFLRAQGDLRRLSRSGITGLDGRLAAALRSFTYLDTDYLKAAILAGLSREADDTPWQVALPIPARQRLLIADLIALLRETPTLLDAPSEAAALLRLYAALVARSARWTDDPLASAFLERLLRVRSLIQRGVISPAALQHLFKGAIHDALRLVDDAPALYFIAGLGSQAEPVMALLGAEPTASTAQPDGLLTRCAGIFLLLRPMLDIRLHSLASQYPFLPGAASDRWSALLLQLGLRCAGEAAVESGETDPGLVIFAGMDTASALTEVQAGWADVSVPDLMAFWSALVNILSGQHLISEEAPHVCHIPIYGDPGAGEAQIGEDASSGVLVMGQVTGAGETVAVEENARFAAGIRETFRALSAGDTGQPQVDVTLRLMAAALLKTWARWLRQFQSSSIPYLLDNFIRREGRITVSDDDIVIEMEARPLDVVLELAGYFGDLDRVEWLGNRRVHFRSMRE